MTFLRLAGLLHEGRSRLFGTTPLPKPLSRTLTELVDAYDHQMHDKFPNVKASIRQFSRTRELPYESMAEKHALMCRFDYAIAVLQFLESCRSENGVRVVPQPDSGIPDEDLIEWALIVPFNAEMRFLNMNAVGQAKLDDSNIRKENEGQA